MIRKIIILSIGLVILYILIAKAPVYQKLAQKIIEWFRKGIQAITEGGIK